MRKVDIHGHAVIPLRAVTIATGGEISPLTIAFAVGDERRFLEDRRFCTRLNAYRLMPDGSPHPMPPVEFADTIGTIEKLIQYKEAFWKQIEALPAGVFVLRQDLNVLLKELNDQRCALPRRGSGRAPIELSDWPSLSGLDERVVLGDLRCSGQREQLCHLVKTRCATTPRRNTFASKMPLRLCLAVSRPYKESRPVVPISPASTRE